MLWETMVAEIRATQLELDNRRHFTAEKEPIQLARAVLADWTEPTAEDPQLVAARTAMSLRLAADDNLFEVG